MSTTLTLGPQAVLKTSGTVFPNTDKSTCRLKTQVMQIREASLKDFYLCNNKCDLKGFQTNFETFFLQVSVTIRQLSIRECLRKKSACTLLKKKMLLVLANKLKFNDCQTIFSSTTFNDLTVRIIYFHQ